MRFYHNAIEINIYEITAIRYSFFMKLLSYDNVILLPLSKLFSTI